MTESQDFSSFQLDPRILDAIKAMGYVSPTPIQAKAIPLVLAGRDVMGAAQTGTGKTAGYGLPGWKAWGLRPADAAADSPESEYERVSCETPRPGSDSCPDPRTRGSGE